LRVKAGDRVWFDLPEKDVPEEIVKRRRVAHKRYVRLNSEDLLEILAMRQAPPVKKFLLGEELYPSSGTKVGNYSFAVEDAREWIQTVVPRMAGYRRVYSFYRPGTSSTPCLFLTHCPDRRLKIVAMDAGDRILLEVDEPAGHLEGPIEKRRQFHQYREQLIQFWKQNSFTPATLPRLEQLLGLLEFPLELEQLEPYFPQSLVWQSANWATNPMEELRTGVASLIGQLHDTYSQSNPGSLTLSASVDNTVVEMRFFKKRYSENSLR